MKYKILLSCAFLLTYHYLSSLLVPSIELAPKTPDEHLLEQAVLHRAWPAVERYILEGINPNTKGYNPLVEAIAEGNKEMIHFLITHGARLDQILYKEREDEPNTVWDFVLEEKDYGALTPELFSMLKHYKNIEFLKKK